MAFKKLAEIIEIANEKNTPMWKVVQEEDCREESISAEESYKKMQDILSAMRDADKNYNAKLTSKSGMAGGDGEKVREFNASGSALVGDFISTVIEKAVKMGESNACMRRIVAAPTAGACGVIPAVLLTYEEEKKAEEEKIIEALYVAAGIGEVLAESASIAGAEGGCQAEIGSAAAMAAGALTYLEGGDNEMILNSVALCIKSILGLTCDPVAGLVEVPCIKRNAYGGVNAVVSAHLAMAGVKSRIPVDEVIDAMGRIGHLIPACLRETGQEGLATTQTAQDFCEKQMQEIG
ncbi:L-serine ammonia-lyase, iron-sulfur-dependent, subunit alpha [Butyrivibrio sp. XPD2002]|uniref:L-serine ammonia-lyase, iron-sulfur-dependent, subunit alpha n=1 Tax=Butyrivibrio sp. XPD2002 TaxID=1280665 RepID=UPI0003FA21F4|nr:L-serine ammonia-lyase, iron-sulfur-dependent, subunit alpha [Butyrivibrio sp. XPD2002]